MDNIPGLENDKIGIITTYKKQVEKLNEKFGAHILKGLEISTVDSFQGKEKDIIILSTVYFTQCLSLLSCYFQNKLNSFLNVFKCLFFGISFADSGRNFKALGGIASFIRFFKFNCEPHRY
jgi:hypothetical protein